MVVSNEQIFQSHTHFQRGIYVNNGRTGYGFMLHFDSIVDEIIKKMLVLD